MFGRKRQPSQFKISIPIIVYNEATIKSLNELKEKVAVTGLPSGWNECTSNSKLLITAVFNDTSLLLVSINESCQLEMYVDGQIVNCDNFEWTKELGTDKEVKSLTCLYAILQHFKGSNICHGNLADQFKDVINNESEYEVRLG